MEKTVQSIDRAFDILEVLAVEKNGLGVTDIGNRAGLHKSTVHRLLKTMAEKGYVEKNPDTGMYRLGLKLIELCSLYLNNIELKTEAQPYLRRLASASGQPVHLAILADGEVVYIDKVESVNSIRMYSAIGRRVPAYCSAVGKVLLAGMNNQQVLDMFKGRELVPRTPKTNTRLESLIEEINRVRRQGWAQDNEENEVGIRCIAAPIYDYRNRVIAAVSISGPMDGILSEDTQGMARNVMQAASDISARLGYILEKTIKRS